ncbi:NAC domain containing protein 103 [Prunus dulcis]|uniref:NAC domain containing protein 103 n=1 Tax=Prunus dulcis TaxID=3755 RepID=A0A4Y1RT60_PRUDU|nr:NAC domain containing protein 103 [Prunus dulcis]
MEKPHVSNDDILSMLNCFTEGSTSLMKENDKMRCLELGNVIPSGNACATPHVNSDDIYEDLGDLGKLARVSEDGYNFSTVHNSICAPAQMLLGDNEQSWSWMILVDPLNCHDSTYTQPLFSQPCTSMGRITEIIILTFRKLTLPDTTLT